MAPIAGRRHKGGIAPVLKHIEAGVGFELQGTANLVRECSITTTVF